MTTKNPSVELTERFIKGLREFNLTLKEITENNWYYCGGDKNQHLNYFKLSCPEDDLPPFDNKCVCGHHITTNCYITNGEDLLILGSCCIKKFVPKSSRTCEKCGTSHKNRKVNKCNDCRSTCEKCGASHKNKKVNECNDCRQGICVDCNAVCDYRHKYCKYCYF
jgi:hypothetical protein